MIFLIFIIILNSAITTIIFAYILVSFEKKAKRVPKCAINHYSALPAMSFIKQ